MLYLSSFLTLFYRISSSYSNSTRKEYNPKDFRNKPQIKLDELHILGIQSIKPFKNNKYIIKAANGTFALPKEKLEKAKKINFNSKLMKWDTN